MTAPSLLDELEGVVRLMEAATPGEWFSQVSDPAEGVDCFWLMSLQASKALTEEVGSVNGSQWDDTQRANAELIARAVNFIRNYHAALAAMAKRLEAAERDAARFHALERFYKAANFQPQDMDLGEGVALVFMLPKGSAVSANLGKTIDAAAQEGKG